MDYKLVDERIQSMMKTISTIKDGTGMEYVSPETYTAFYETMERQLEGEVLSEESEILTNDIYTYLNKAISDTEHSLKEYVIEKNYANEVYKEFVAISIILHEAKIKLLKRDYNFIGESYE